MKLVYNDIETVMTLSPSYSTVLSVENPMLFRQMIENLQAQMEGNDGKFVLSDKGIVQKITSKLMFIDNPVHVEINGRKVLTKLYDVLSGTAVGEDMYIKTMNIKTQIKSYLDDLLFDGDYDLDYDDDFELKKLFSAVNLRFNEEYEDALEKLVIFMDVLSKFSTVKVLIFVNLVSYFSEIEIDMLRQEAENRHFSLLLIESVLRSDVMNAKVVVVDKDLCVVRSDF